MQILAYADDVIVARYENAVKDAFNRLEKASQKMGLMIMIKYMETTCKPNREKYIRINNSDIERVNQFKYLGSIIIIIIIIIIIDDDDDDDDMSEISHRINMGNTCYYGMRNILRSRLLKKDTKCKIYKTLIRPVVLYGCESWTLTKKRKKNLTYLKERYYGKFMAQAVLMGYGY
jgi:hypothetical protein